MIAAMQHPRLRPALQPAIRRAAALLAWLAACAAVPAFGFGFDEVAREADRVARAPYRALPAVDPAVQALGYDRTRQQRFRAEHSTWRGSGSRYELQYFPLGNGNVRPLAMYEVVGDAVRPLQLPAGAFEHGGTGIAGWRLNQWLDAPPRSDEVVAFLGASYFRVLAQGLRYGVSARGVAVDTVGATGEEFPVFTTFWVQRPQPGDSAVQAWALLESPRVTGAYGFVIRPGTSTGTPTTVDVRARLTLRANVTRLGIAPLTSMFLAGEVQPQPQLMTQDYRPEVHDSDGLQIAAGDGEWLWRPLTNPAGVFLTGHAMRSVRGYGLMQRDRAHSSYQDLEARYELRPSAWIEPLGDWGPGRVELLQFHTPDETHDNIGAWWLPERLPPPGQPFEFAWRLHVSDRQPMPPGGWVAQSRRGHGYRAGALPAGQVQYQIDFEGPALAGLVEGEVEPVASGNANVRKLRAVAYPNPVLPGWRVGLEYERIDPAQPVELRLFLRSGARTLTETWSHASAPE